MPKLVVHGASLKCSQGTSPGSLSVSPSHDAKGDAQALATVDDYQPNVNLPTFGMCQSMANPQVSSATSAAQGVLTPQPCNPLVTSAWSPGVDGVKVKGTAALGDDATCNCQWNGRIEVVTPAQSSIQR